jgi:hypothetical protein
MPSIICFRFQPLWASCLRPGVPAPTETTISNLEFQRKRKEQKNKVSSYVRFE